VVQAADQRSCDPGSLWLAPFMVPIDVALIGKIDTNLDAFVERCQRLIFEGPMDVEIARVE
jgi:hypothetical protein